MPGITKEIEMRIAATKGDIRVDALENVSASGISIPDAEIVAFQFDEEPEAIWEGVQVELIDPARPARLNLGITRFHRDPITNYRDRGSQDLRYTPASGWVAVGGVETPIAAYQRRPGLYCF